MTVLPGMPAPNPDATKGCENACVRGLVERDDGTFYPCPTHRAEAFKKWSAGKYPGWREMNTDPAGVD